MLSNALKVIFGSRNDRLLKEYRRTVVTINALEREMALCTDPELASQASALTDLLLRERRIRCYALATKKEQGEHSRSVAESLRLPPASGDAAARRGRATGEPHDQAAAGRRRRRRRVAACRRDERHGTDEDRRKRVFHASFNSR